MTKKKTYYLRIRPLEQWEKNAFKQGARAGDPVCAPYVNGSFSKVIARHRKEGPALNACEDNQKIIKMTLPLGGSYQERAFLGTHMPNKVDIVSDKVLAQGNEIKEQ